MATCTPVDILNFWFRETRGISKFVVNKDFDEYIRKTFSEVHERAAKKKLKAWRVDAWGSLAEIIVLDQFSRHIHRGRAKAFANDKMALHLAGVAIRKGFDKLLPISWLKFLYMPYMHSESKRVHEQMSMKLFRQQGLENSYRYERQHKSVLDKFGRYPYRNAALGRVSTPEEILYLARS